MAMTTDLIESQCTEGRLKDAVIEAARELYPWLGTVPDGVDSNLYLKLQHALDAVQNKQDSI